MDIDKPIFKFALQNAVKYGGKAQAKSIMPKVMQHCPDCRKNITQTLEEINKVVEQVNSLNKTEQLELLKKLAPEPLKSKPKKQRPKLKELKNTKKVVMRFAPSPSGPMHIGHALTGGLTSLYTKKYKGKFILRIEDTNPDNIDPDAYEFLQRDADWLFGNISEVWIQSDRIKIYYKYIEKLLKLNAIYICTCSQEKFKQHSTKKQQCPCRKKPNQKQRWEKMLNPAGFKEGEAVLRFKADMKHKNPAMRDFPLARINLTQHPKQGKKYRVWPLMNLSVTVDDIEAGMTHIIRGKDHMDNSKRQELIYKVLKKPIPLSYFIGRYKFKGLELSCSKTKEKINAGEYHGWDDIRLPFINSLRKRGYQAKAFLNYTENIGLSQVDKTITNQEFFKAIDFLNKEILDSKSNRYFFVENPKKITIKNAPTQEIKIRIHPDFPKRGNREFKTNKDFYITKQDFNNIKKAKEYRLMGTLNFKNNKFLSKSVKDYQGNTIIHWLPQQKDLVKTEVLMPDNKKVTGLSEPSIKKLKQGDIIQFERFGFCRLNKKQKDKFIFWYAHK